MIFQDPTGALNARQTLYEAVAEGIRIQGLKGDEEQIVAEALASAGIRPPESFFTRYPYEISGGQRQRVIIAGAMVLDPACSWRTSPCPRWTPPCAGRSCR